MTLDAEPGGAAARRGNVRASSAEREQAIELIKAAFAEGRLTMDEHLERVERAYTSRTCAELAALAVDLPSGPSQALQLPAAGCRPGQLAAAESRANPLAVASFACGLIPLLPATLAALVLGLAARRQIKRTGDRGDALATTGIALATLWMALTVVVLIAVR